MSDQPFAALMESGSLSSLIDLRRLHDIPPLLASVDLDAPPRKMKCRSPSFSPYITYELLAGNERRWSVVDPTRPLVYEWRKYMSEKQPLKNWARYANSIYSAVIPLQPDAALRHFLTPQEMYDGCKILRQENEKAKTNINRLKNLAKSPQTEKEIADWRKVFHSADSHLTVPHFLMFWTPILYKSEKSSLFGLCRKGEGGREGGREAYTTTTFFKKVRIIFERS